MPRDIATVVEALVYQAGPADTARPSYDEDASILCRALEEIPNGSSGLLQLGVIDEVCAGHAHQLLVVGAGLAGS